MDEPRSDWFPATIDPMRSGWYELRSRDRLHWACNRRPGAGGFRSSPAFGTCLRLIRHGDAESDIAGMTDPNCPICLGYGAYKRKF